MTANPEAFEAYFRVADADRDGRISGAEAVAFFQGSSLPQVTLAKIWQYAETSHTGYLGRLEFFNALKLVTVAQSGRDLTPELVRSALTGPAASQIPAPKIIIAAFSQSGATGVGLPAQQFSSGGGTTARSSQLPSQFPGVEVKQGLVRPGSEGARLAGLAPAVSDVSSAPLFGNLGLDAWIKPRASSTSSTIKQEVRTPFPATSLSLHDVFSDGEFKAAPSSAGSSGAAATSVTKTVSANIPDSTVPSSAAPTRITANTPYGFDAFAAYNLKPSSPPQGPRPLQNVGLTSGLEAGNRTPRGILPTVQPGLTTQPLPQPESTSQPPGSPRAVPAQHLAVQMQRQSFALSPLDFGGEVDEATQGGAPWPKMTHTELERYSKMFVHLDADKDGKITGVQARDLFLGWRLALDMLKQVWDLADQDVDGMLSQREFCTAMYLIERYREGRPLPPLLPTGFYLEAPSQDLPSGNVSLSGPVHPASQNVPGGPPGHIPSEGGTAVGPSFSIQSKVPVLDSNLVGQLPRNEQETLTTTHREAEELDTKVLEAGKDEVETKQKIDYYRAKLQELILFKSRSESQLIDITERTAADKRELEMLPKKFDEKVKQLNDANARLVAQDEGFRDIQRRKAEISDAIARLEQGDPKGLSQARADRLWSEMDELRKNFSARCQQLGLHIPSGQAEAHIKYDEHWDKFHDGEAAKTVVSSSMSRNSPVLHGAGILGADHTHHDFRHQNHPVGKSNLGIPAASTTLGDIQSVFGEPETFDWRDAYREENDASTRSQGRSQDSRSRVEASELRQTSQYSSHSDAWEGRGRGKLQQGHDHGLAGVSPDKSAIFQRDSAAHGSPIFSSSPVHHYQESKESRDSRSGVYKEDAARYDDDPFVGMGPFGGGS